MIPAGDFTPVMATAIMAIAAREHGLGGLAWALTAVAWVLLAGLAGLHAHRSVRRRPADAAASWRALSLVAAVDVLAIASARALPAGGVLAMWLAALGAWAVLATRAVRVCRSGRPRPRGLWLLLVVATQSLAIVAAGGRLPGTLPGPAAALFAVATSAYLVIVAGIAHEWTRRPRLVQWRADGWIVMGALAITAVAGSELHRSLALVLPWAAATLSIPVLAGLDVAALRARGGGITRESDRWAMAFPLAMWSVAGHAVARRFGVPALDAVGAAALVAAAIAWLVAARATEVALRSAVG